MDEFQITVTVKHSGNLCWSCQFQDYKRARCKLFDDKLEYGPSHDYMRTDACMKAEKKAKEV